MASPQAAPAQPDRLMGVRPRASYNAAEQQFSSFLQERLQQLLEGKCNALELMRRYPADPDRLGVMVTPDGLPREELRLPVVEALVSDAIRFARSDETAGPVAQAETSDGTIFEFQIFSTKFPHIIIDRTDRYVGDGAEPVDITWCLRRVQNQRTQTQFNRLLDAANLAFEFLHIVR